MWIKIWSQGKTILVVFVLLVLALSGCVESSSWGNAPDFTLTTIDGDTFTLSDHLGKVIVIDLMAVRCPPCETQMIYLKELHDEVGDQVVMISIDVDGTTGYETEGQVKEKFGDYIGIWTFAMDTSKEKVGTQYKVQYIPTIVIIDTKGDVSYKYHGAHTTEKLLEEINEASE